MLHRLASGIFIKWLLQSTSRLQQGRGSEMLLFEAESKKKTYQRLANERKKLKCKGQKCKGKTNTDTGW